MAAKDRAKERRWEKPVRHKTKGGASQLRSSGVVAVLHSFPSALRCSASVAVLCPSPSIAGAVWGTGIANGRAQHRRAAL